MGAVAAVAFGCEGNASSTTLVTVSKKNMSTSKSDRANWIARGYVRVKYASRMLVPGADGRATITVSMPHSNEDVRREDWGHTLAELSRIRPSEMELEWSPDRNRGRHNAWPKRWHDVRGLSYNAMPEKDQRVIGLTVHCAEAPSRKKDTAKNIKDRRGCIFALDSRCDRDKWNIFYFPRFSESGNSSA